MAMSAVLIALIVFARGLEDYASLSYPLIKINDYFFADSEIDSFTINSNGFLPTISLTVTLMNRLFLSKHMPKDGDVISVMIRNKSDSLNPIRNDYVITGTPSKPVIPNERAPVTLTFFGELFVPALKTYLGSQAIKGTSMEVLKELASRLELGFNTNETDTDDYQIWINSESAEEFIKEVTSKSWKEENAFFDSWIDIYYNLNFVNVQKILLAQEEDVDPAAFLGNIDTEFTWGSNTEEEETISIPKILSNFSGYRTSSSYIINWKPNNRSSSITFEYGTSMECSFFEHLNVLYDDPEARKYWTLEVAPDYDTEKINNHILLRGRTQYDASIHRGEQARSNYNYKEIYKRSPWLGIQYTINNSGEEPNSWSGNHHQNYMRAQVHNLVNLIELNKFNLEVRVQGTNANIIKGDKLPLILVKGDMHEAQLVHPEENPREAVDLFYTGWYFVKGFSLSWSKPRDQIASYFSQTFILTRREWTPPERIEPAKEAYPQNNINVS